VSAAKDRGRAAALLHLLTDFPDDQIRASIDTLSRDERDRLDALAVEVFKDHSDCSTLTKQARTGAAGPAHVVSR
jgi:hypothetical protein